MRAPVLATFLLLIPGLAHAQSAEQVAERKARCVQKAIGEAANAGTATAGVKSCLTEADVYQLGWFSFLQDTTPLGGRCRLTKGAAFKYGRTARNEDGDLINGAVRWQPLEGDWERTHPFFRGQGDARIRYRTASDAERCKALTEGFGPRGDRFPGLVR